MAETFMGRVVKSNPHLVLPRSGAMVPHGVGRFAGVGPAVTPALSTVRRAPVTGLEAAGLRNVVPRRRRII
jgi:hypothetical protein